MHSLRVTLNNKIYEWGNKSVPHLPVIERLREARTREYDVPYGLGDFLTQDITKPKVYATIGATVPVAATYGFYTTAGAGPFFSGLATAITVIGCAPVYLTFPIVGAAMGTFAQQEDASTAKTTMRMEEQRLRGNLLGLIE